MVRKRHSHIKRNDRDTGNISKVLDNLPPKKRLFYLKAAHMIDLSSELDEETRGAVEDSALDFSMNPREIKRFVNMLRFQTFLLDAMLASNKPDKRDPPSPQQLRSWIRLSLKWPAVVRWLYESSVTEEKTRTSRITVPVSSQKSIPFEELKKDTKRKKEKLVRKKKTLSQV